MPKHLRNAQGQTFYAALHTDATVGYVINCYIGVVADNRGRYFRRAFQWTTPDGTVHQGNTEAFTLHLGTMLGLPVETSKAAMVHKLLRDLGELLKPHTRGHASPDDNGPTAGRYAQPEPEEWMVRKTTGLA